jgi:predicted AAA+ superfamily ATPase
MSAHYYSRFLQFDPPATARRGPGSTPKVTLILGARQTGKSTLLNHSIRGRDRTLSINLQDRRLLSAV